MEGAGICRNVDESEGRGGEPELRRGKSLNKRMATDARFIGDLVPGRQGCPHVRE